MLKVKRLTSTEEKELLLEVEKDFNFLDNGSSRVVFSLDNGYVLKLGMGEEGRFQNSIEVETFEATEFPEYFAEIVAAGEHVVVMEEIEVVNFEEIVDMYEDEEDSIVSIVNAAAEINGDTDDNFQIGFNGTDYKIFDYGYRKGYHEKSVGNAYSYGRNGIKKYIREIVFELSQIKFDF